MAKSRCPRCQHTAFELQPAPVKNSVYQIYFVQCTACGTVVGVTDDAIHLVATLLETLNIKL